VEKAVTAKKARVVGLDTISPRMFAPWGQYILQMTPAPSLSELRGLLVGYLAEIGAEDVAWTHYIRHRQTLDVLRTEFPELPPEPNYATYKYRPGDVFIVAVLRRRSSRRNPCAPLSPDDLTYWLVAVKRKIPAPALADAIPKL
jgi:hypothetical protein